MQKLDYSLYIWLASGYSPVFHDEMTLRSVFILNVFIKNTLVTLFDDEINSVMILIVPVK